MEKKVFSLKHVLYGFLIGSLIMSVIIGVVAYKHFNDLTAAEQLRQTEQAEYEKKHALVVRDSMVIVNRNKEEYARQISQINARTAIRSSIKYRIGDIVYIKPDSVKGVVQDVGCDSLMMYYYYYIATHKDGSTTILAQIDTRLVY